MDFFFDSCMNQKKRRPKRCLFHIIYGHFHYKFQPTGCVIIFLLYGEVKTLCTIFGKKIYPSSCFSCNKQFHPPCSFRERPLIMSNFIGKSEMTPKNRTLEGKNRTLGAAFQTNDYYLGKYLSKSM